MPPAGYGVDRQRKGRGHEQIVTWTAMPHSNCSVLNEGHQTSAPGSRLQLPFIFHFQEQVREEEHLLNLVPAIGWFRSTTTVATTTEAKAEVARAPLHLAENQYSNL